jgi:hypothetical protein
MVERIGDMLSTLAWNWLLNSGSEGWPGDAKSPSDRRWSAR